MPRKKLLKFGILILSVVLLASLLTGCIISPAGVAPSTAPITADDKVTKLGPASGSAWGFMVFGLLPLSEAWTYKAVDRAVKSKDADALINVTLDNQVCLFPIVHIYRTKVQGEAVKISKGG